MLDMTKLQLSYLKTPQQITDVLQLNAEKSLRSSETDKNNFRGHTAGGR